MPLSFFLQIFLCCCLLGTPEKNLGAETLELRLLDQASVNGDQILLRDIVRAVPEGAAICQKMECVVAPAPQPGQSKKLTAQELKTRLHRELQDTNVIWSGAPEVVATRSGILIGKEKIEEILAGFLQENQDKLPQAEIRLASMQPPADFFLPEGHMEYRVTPSNPDILNSSSLNIIFQVDGKIIKNISAKVRFEAMAEVATAAVSLHKDTLISPEQIRMQRIDIVGTKSPFFTPDSLIGLMVNRTISSGKIIEAEQVGQPPDINKGEQVKILARKGKLSLSAGGLAYSSGHIGDVIRVLNTSSNKLILCRIEAPGTVSVEF